MWTVRVMPGLGPGIHVLGRDEHTNFVSTMISNRHVQIERSLAVLKWMTGATLAGVVALVIKTFIT
jgi:hypothetical protein